MVVAKALAAPKGVGLCLGVAWKQNLSQCLVHVLGPVGLGCLHSWAGRGAEAGVEHGGFGEVYFPKG